MDNKTYLDQIAVKGASGNKAAIITPAMIKFIIAGVIAFIVIILVGPMLNSSSQENTEAYTKLYIRTANLADQASSPLEAYKYKIKSTKILQYNSMLVTSLTNFNNTYGALAEVAGFSTTGSAETAAEEAEILNSITNDFERGYLNGTLGQACANSMTYQISLMLSLIQEIRATTTNEQVAVALDGLKADLEKIQPLYTNYKE